MKKTPVKSIFSHYTKLYEKKFDIQPVINLNIGTAVVKNLLKTHSQKGLERIIDLYFEDKANENQSYHLPNILCAYSLNKYLPKIKLNPNIYDNAEELNKEIY